MSGNTETAILAGGCFGPRRNCCATAKESSPPASATPAGATTTRPPAAIPATQAVEVIFDPERTCYRDILEFFFQIHRPDLGEGAVGSGYRSEIFYTSNEQREVAEATIADAGASGLWPGKVVTKISEAGPFREAEAEDQDYLQHYPDGKNQFRL
jgi:peptide-methionine (S)-S-oxide reductase